LRDEGSGSVIYHPYPYPLSKRLSESTFLSNIWIMISISRNMIMVCSLPWTWTKQF